MSSRSNDLAASAKSKQSTTFKDPPPELLNRLIYGLKAKVDKREYEKLSSKNYAQLPEVVQRRVDEKKKLEQAERMRLKKEFEQVLNSHKLIINHLFNSLVVHP